MGLKRAVCVCTRRICGSSSFPKASDLGMCSWPLKDESDERCFLSFKLWPVRAAHAHSEHSSCAPRNSVLEHIGLKLPDFPACLAASTLLGALAVLVSSVVLVSSLLPNACPAPKLFSPVMRQSPLTWAVVQNRCSSFCGVCVCVM